MNRPETVSTDLYALYCEYIRQINRSSRLGRERFSEVSIVSQADFQAIWDALSESRRRLWQRKFEAGHDEVAKLERRKLVAALTSNGSDQIEFNAVRAA
jgi:hypothetical protein